MQMTSFSFVDGAAELEFPVDDEIPKLDEVDDEEDVVFVADEEDATEAATEEFKHCCNFFNCVSIVSIRSRKLSESWKKKMIRK